MTRSTASLFMPILVLVALAAVLILKPWKHTSVGGPALPTLSAAAAPAQPARSDNSGATKVSRGRLEVLLANENGMHWSCTNDSSGRWDYTCLLRANDSVWGFDVDRAKITSRSELSWEGHTLSP